MINNSDLYNESALVNDIKKEYCEDVTDDALLLSLFGYFGEIEARNIRNSIVVQSELSNEFFASRCKKDNNIILHAISNNITDILATPASINAIIGIKEADIKAMMDGGNTAIIYNDCKIYIEDFEFHLDYDIILTKSVIVGEEVIYSARYDIGSKSDISDIENPYLQAPIIITINNERYIFIYCLLRQVMYTDIENKFISNNTLENKIIDFEFEDQLATFYVTAIDDGVITNLTPILEGANVNGVLKYCNYSYIDNSTIRIVFDANSYMPGLNTQVQIKVLTTKGSLGNFSYNKQLIVSLESEKGNYNNISAILTTQSDSTGGKDKKTTAELQAILPKEALAKGTISIYKSLENKFNTFNTSKFKIKLEQRVDNQVERSYFSYLAIKDESNDIIPTNTITAKIKETQFGEKPIDNIYVIPQGSYIVSKNNSDTPEIFLKPSETDLKDATYIYTVPFMTVINYKASYVAFYSNLINKNKLVYFRDINSSCQLQYIATRLNWKREYLTDKDKYKFTIELNQNIDYDYNMVNVSNAPDTGAIIYKSNVRAIAVIYDEDGSAYRYIEGALTNYNETTYACTFGFELQTNDSIDSKNRIRINNVKDIGTNSIAYGHMPSTANVDIFVLVKLEDAEYGRFELDNYVPNLDGYSVCNVYNVNEGLDFFINYSGNISSIIEFSQEAGSEVFTIKSLPVVKRKYLQAKESNIQYLMSSLAEKKTYIDIVRKTLDNNFNIDMKFFNTHGYSKRFMIDAAKGTLLDKVNIVPKFRIQTLPNADPTVIKKIKKDIKDLVEDITANSLPSIHFAKIVGNIYTKYKDSIEFIQFNGINSYGPEVQYLERIPSRDILSVPEIISIDENEDGSPAITIV